MPTAERIEDSIKAIRAQMGADPARDKELHTACRYLTASLVNWDKGRADDAMAYLSAGLAVYLGVE